MAPRPKVVFASPVRGALAAGLALALAGCPADDPVVTPDAPPGLDAPAIPDAREVADAFAPGDGGAADARVGPSCDPHVEDVSACVPAPTDYQPRANGSADDAWPACISDDDAYHPIQASISSIARVAAFEAMAALLWENPAVPTSQDFLDARAAYAADQGLDSRVQRREDVHYPALPDGHLCSEAGMPDLYPDRCAGPARLLPILNDAFQQGLGGADPRVQAARVQAALVWFLYLSSLSEAMSCTTRPQDCDSCWAYYTGGTERASPLGLARLVRAAGPETHERAYDGTLAVRCWRNLDNETGTATDLALRDRALDQLDRALVRGVALLTRARLVALACASGDERRAARAFAEVIVPLLDRAARERDPALADAVLAAVAVDPGAAALAAAVDALDALFPCP